MPFEEKPYIHTSMPDVADADMLALSADLFSYLESASTAAGGADAGMTNGASDVENLGTGSLKPATQPSAAGPLRHRRGYQDRQLSINSFASNTSNSDLNRQDPISTDSTEVKTTTSSEHRTVKVGDHAFTIPMSSPVIPPQLQANMRMTSTGRPSHARKVPEDHVKVSRSRLLTMPLLLAYLQLSPATTQCFHPVPKLCLHEQALASFTRYHRPSTGQSYRWSTLERS